MWFILFAVCTFKIICIFIFIIYCVVTFLLVMYNARTEELRKCILPQNINLEVEFLIESRDSVDDKLEVLTEKLTEKVHVLQNSQCEIKNTEKVLTDLENKTLFCRDRYRPLMIELKKDIRKTEDEVKTLQNQISNLSFRRESLRSEVLKQQEDYQKMLNNFSKELENKKTLFSSGIEKLRHPRVSHFILL
ncbi:PREDICTED: uncharacterized protein LOC108550146 [Eufriesea mexicana]|uniref:uncharacterized protein LOC108550146 n=1 Tax=Eufriesea mexicana TaxID=516756 RepID=UPI00083C04FE|nr:PREDICTED: uncharacterized protein LOC108550146 [Eufriesea mexicana]